MDLVPFDIVTSDVSDRFNRIGPAFDLNFVAFHDFLNFATNIAHSRIDTSMLTTISVSPLIEQLEMLTLIPVLVASLTD